MKPKSRRTTGRISSLQEFNQFCRDVGERVTSEILQILASPHKICHIKIPTEQQNIVFFSMAWWKKKNSITSSKNKSSKDLYGLTNLLVKKLYQEIAVPMTILINKCFTEEMRIAEIILIHKKGAKEKYIYYRLILPIYPKLWSWQ